MRVLELEADADFVAARALPRGLLAERGAVQAQLLEIRAVLARGTVQRVIKALNGGAGRAGRVGADGTADGRGGLGVQDVEHGADEASLDATERELVHDLHVDLRERVSAERTAVLEEKRAVASAF